MNLRLRLGIQINPNESRAQKILAMNITIRISGMSFKSVTLNGNKNDMIVIIPLVFFSTTIIRFSYHENLSSTVSASLYMLK